MKKYLYILLLAFITANSLPISDPGPDQNVAFGATVVLDGSKSYDSDGDNLTYSWTTNSDAVSLSNNSVASPSFTAPTSADIITFKLNSELI